MNRPARASDPELRLAPMAGATNAPFRLVARECGAGLLTSEEIDARALVAGNSHTQVLARHLPAEHPIALQLLGSDPDVLAEAARRLEATGADAVDLNMGCPVAKIVAKGQGAALLRDPLGAAPIFRAMRKAIAVPLTIKIRGGWDEGAVNAPEIARVAESEGVDAVTVHPRTRSQQFSGQAPWEIIASVVDAVAIPVTGNGDVRTRADALAMARATGCAAIMIGRGALGAPWVFGAGAHLSQATHDGRGLAGPGAHLSQATQDGRGLAGPATTDATRLRHASIIRRHCELIEAHLPPRLALLQLKKHLCWYAGGWPFAARLRGEIFAAPDADSVRRIFWDGWRLGF